jgi:hypothetical protein
MGILPKKGALGHFVRVFVVFAGLFAPGTLAADPRSDLAPVRSLRRLTQTPVGYLQSTKLTADDGAGTDEFGKSVSIDGDTIVIGAWHDDDKGFNSGSAYVFTRTRCWNETTGDVSSSYTQVAKLTADDGAGKFGISVSIDGDTIVIEAGNDDSAYVFTRDTAGDLASGWTQVAKLVADDGAGGDSFGNSVSINGDTIVIGADHSDNMGTDSGSAYVFTRDTAGDLASAWTQVAMLTADDGDAVDKFGNSVSVDGDTIVIGAWHDVSKTGSVYVFTRDTAGDLASGWTQVAKLTADDAAVYDQFGISVSVDGDTIVIGAWHDDDKGTDSGSAYVFTRDTAGDFDSGWTQVTKLTASDGDAVDNFGISVSIDGDTIVIGARKDDDGPGDSGSAYVFTRDTAGDLASGWTQVTKLHADDRNQHDHFGTSVSVDGGMIVIGALFHDANGLGDSGSAYVYTLASDSTSLTRPCSCCDSKMVSRGFNKACNFELAGVPHCQI